MSVVLVFDAPQHPGNIVTCIRNARMMGFADVRLVNPICSMEEVAYRMTAHEQEFCSRITMHESMAEAVSDCSFLVATTARIGGWREHFLPLRESAPRIMSESRVNKVAVLFGCEKWGLSNQIIAVCDLIITIPVTKSQKSLNLGQAVLLVGYELYAHQEANSGNAKANRVEFQIADTFFNRLMQLFIRINFFPGGYPEFWMMRLRRVFSKAGATAEEISEWHRILDAIEEHLE